MERIPTNPQNPPADGWAGWLEAHGEVFFLYARQQTRSEPDARDVLQEALAEAWVKASGATPDRALVFATIRRRAIDLGRKIDRRSQREQSYLSDRQAWFVTDFALADSHEHLATVVQQLPEKLREVLTLKIWGELTFPEIAELIGIPVATATSRFRYSLERLRESECLTELRP